ncbi:uncharacterized protein LOC107874454 [Capsicum annuum]|uniref:uncharacterized protein LOC107874454 n=1 Tax=Capsicum annuum TaxID=4072 RepID=UPI0007BF6C17|nr:uncharacterized protein LOC107874454 [Capsicum annuum]
MWMLTSFITRGVRRGNGVGFIVDEELRGEVVEVKRVNDRLMMIKLVIGGFTMNVSSVYAPQVSLDDEKKKQFWEASDKVVRDIPNSENIIAAGDFTGYIGVLSGGYGDVHGSYGFGERSKEGVALLDFARALRVVVVNLSFLKRRITWSPSKMQ